MNLPAQFVERINGQLASSAADFLDAIEQPASVSLRVHTGKFEGSLQLESVPWAKDGYYLEHRPVFTLDPLFHAGCYYVQEASSMLLEQAVRQLGMADAPVKVLDLCGAPGGKSTHLMSLLQPDSLLISNEVIRSRAWILAENVTKWSGTNTIVSNNDPADFGRLGEQFDLIVVDAPCSGEGLFRKDRESLNQWSLENLNLCSQRQHRILNDALPALKLNGYLVYSTCTYNPAENEEVVQWLINEHGYELVDLEIDSEWGLTERTIEKGVGYQAFPHRVQGEGFFLAVLRKQETSKSQPAEKRAQKPRRPKKKKRNRCGICEPKSEQSTRHAQFAKVHKRDSKELLDWIELKDEIKLIRRNEQIFAMRKNLSEEAISLGNQLKIVTLGTEVGKTKKHGFVPSHALAISSILNSEACAQEEITWQQAIRYLRHEPITTSLPDGVGFVTFEGCPLGWVKQIGNRSNNWYPNEWRIRMRKPDQEPWTLLKERLG